MDIFDQYLFDELVSEYEKEDLSFENYEELYQRFCNLSYLSEVKPYLFVMRFYGMGVEESKEGVLDELKVLLDSSDIILNGLYYDLVLSLDEKNDYNLLNLKRAVELGYSNKYTKDKSFVCYVKEIDGTLSIFRTDLEVVYKLFSNSTGRYIPYW